MGIRPISQIPDTSEFVTPRHTFFVQSQAVASLHSSSDASQYLFRVTAPARSLDLFNVAGGFLSYRR
jgi:hypothetical protein